jgi:hypothetical protein
MSVLKGKNTVNKKRYFSRIISVLFIPILFLSCEKDKVNGLNFPFVDQEIKVDADLEKHEWKNSVLVNGLISPWDNSGFDETRFNAYVSNDYFNFCFVVSDNTPVTFQFENELTVAKEDRVELFFSNDTTLDNYYCIEMDPNGNILDYSAKFYRQFNESWNFTSKEIATKVIENGYIVEGRISLDELRKLGITEQYYLGVFRADFKSSDPSDVTWYSWIKPNSKEPDFHIPSAFGQGTIPKE